VRLYKSFAAIMTITACYLAGCGSGTSTSTSTTTTTTTADMGTLTTMGDTYTYTIKNAASSMVLGISGQSQTNSAYVVQESSSTSTTDIDWHFMPIGTDEYNAENMLTHQVLGIQSASTSTGARALQYPDNGTDDHKWEFYLLTDGNYLIKNVNSGYYLEDADSSTSSSATIDQGTRSSSSTGCTCQEWAITSTGTAAYPSPMSVSGTGIYVHDPFMLQDPTTHYYWLYGTHQTMAYATSLSSTATTASPNVFTWTKASSDYGACTAAEGTYWLTVDSRCPIIGPDFASWSGLQTPPTYNNDENIDVWAPSVLYSNGTYYQYYSIPYEPSTGAEAVIGLATAATPYGNNSSNATGSNWTDHGYVISSWTAGTTTAPTSTVWNFDSTTTWNAIDPAPFVDASGNWWLVFGSWEDGTHLIPLDSSTGLRSGTTMYKIGYRPAAGEEGPFIYYYPTTGYYYYFAPINTCCDGTSSTYRTIVGRASTVTGPYYDRSGIDLASSGGTILVSSHGNIYGPGGGSVFTDTGSDGTQSLPTFVYHYYDGNNSGTPTLGINRLGFDSDGWPYIK